MTSPTMKTATEQRVARELNKARQCEDRAQESFERCDTDGFLTQWANGIMAQVHRDQATIEANNGLSEFPALFDAAGNRVRAKLIQQGKFGPYWMFFDKYDKPIGVFCGDSKGGPRSKIFKMGLTRGTEKAPAKAGTAGTGTGLSGTCWAVVYRTDKGYPENAVELTQ